MPPTRTRANRRSMGEIHSVRRFSLSPHLLSGPSDIPASGRSVFELVSLENQARWSIRTHEKRSHLAPSEVEREAGCSETHRSGESLYRVQPLRQYLKLGAGFPEAR